ncbi:hypothetical protein [Microbacterium sp.]|uniref:NACHT domain-containing protein n=1 Tax=Microbacterium sp. TaxID=51671 RepID=UPI00289C014A|nr:hypothetical protein [Microbacterium sp.]
MLGIALKRRERTASRAGLIVTLLAAAAAVSVTALTALPARDSAASWDGRVVEATGEVTSSASVGRDGRLWMEIQLVAIGSPGSVCAASAPARVGIDPADGFDLGARVSVIGEAAATGPGERAALVVFASSASVERPASGVFAVAAELRSIFIDRAQRLPEPGAGLLPGLAVGDTRAVSQELTEQMKASGLSHLTAVSGANVKPRDECGGIAWTIRLTPQTENPSGKPWSPQHPWVTRRGECVGDHDTHRLLMTRKRDDDWRFSLPARGTDRASGCDLDSRFSSSQSSVLAFGLLSRRQESRLGLATSACQDAGMDYSFANLGTEAFERLAQALSIAELGNNVQPTGVGRDRGRDAFFNGRVSYGRRGGSGDWDGYGVIQAKHLARDRDTSANPAWVKARMREELRKWMPGEHGEDPVRVDPPQYYLFLTSATLSPEGYDECVDELAHLCKQLGSVDWDLWDRERISRLLDGQTHVRRTYLHLIVPGDVLAALEDGYRAEPVLDVGKQLVAQAATDLSQRQWARMGDSGVESEEKFKLASVVVDVPAVSGGWIEPDDPTESNAVGALDFVLRLGDESLRPKLEPEHRGVLLVGGPGQGKSTIAQVLCQIYRASFIDQSSALSKPQQELVSQLKTAMRRMGVTPPNIRRWPVFVDLSAFGDALSADENYSLLRYIAESSRIHGERMDTADIVRWRSAWPWMLVLDGLDEVVHPVIRQRVSAALDEFLTDCSVNDADVLLVATTRPQGYRGELSDFGLQQLDLAYLSTEEALRYGELLAAERNGGDTIAFDRVVERLREAASNSTTSRLMTTPLQITIMSTLLERLSQVPDTRHALFDAYYRAIYTRERTRASSLGKILTAHERVIDYLHEQVALFLHARAAEGGISEPLIEGNALRPLIFARLKADEYDDSEADRLAAEIIRAVHDRVVLITGIRDGLVGFEVRILQEYFAARAITRGPEAQIVDLMARIGPALHWRQTFLLAAGRLQNHANPQIIDALLLRLEELDTTSEIAMEVASGERIALDLLDDAFAERIPRVRRVLLRRALGILDHWGDDKLVQLAHVAEREIELSTETYKMVQNAVESRLGSPGAPRSSTAGFLTVWQRREGKPGTLANYVLGKAHGWRPAQHEVHPRAVLAKLIEPLVDRTILDADSQRALNRALGESRRSYVLQGTSAAEVGTYARRGERTILPGLLSALGLRQIQCQIIAALPEIDEASGGLGVVLREHMVVLVEADAAGAQELVSREVLDLLGNASEAD